MTDELTSLANRRRFMEVLALELKRAERFGSPLALVLVDLDDFKSVNDEHGHLCGDDVLAAVAGVLRDAVRGSDQVCRLGGDEFAVILERSSLIEAKIVAEHVRQALAAHVVNLDSGEVCQQASIGIATTDGVAGVDAETLLREADRAMYDAKPERQPVRLKLVSDAGA